MLKGIQKIPFSFNESTLDNSQPIAEISLPEESHVASSEDVFNDTVFVKQNSVCSLIEGNSSKTSIYEQKQTACQDDELLESCFSHP